MVLSVFVYAFFGRLPWYWLIVSRVGLLLPIAGLAYELIRYAGKHQDNRVLITLLAPGLCGWSFHAGPPTDDQVEVFLRETDWTPTLGLLEDSEPRTTVWLAAGGVDPAAWKKALGRDVPVRMFPELRVSSKE